MVTEVEMTSEVENKLYKYLFPVMEKNVYFVTAGGAVGIQYV